VSATAPVLVRGRRDDYDKELVVMGGANVGARGSAGVAQAGAERS